MEYGPNVRVVSKPTGNASTDLLVQTRAGTSYPWKTQETFNDAEDDMAEAHAVIAAREAYHLREAVKARIHNWTHQPDSAMAVRA